MTTLFRPVTITSAEQAEALPHGTIAISEQFAPEVFVRDEGSWLGTHGPGGFTDESVIGFTALVPIEAEEWMRNEVALNPHSEEYRRLARILADVTTVDAVVDYDLNT